MRRLARMYEAGDGLQPSGSGISMSKRDWDNIGPEFSEQMKHFAIQRLVVADSAKGNRITEAL